MQNSTLIPLALSHQRHTHRCADCKHIIHEMLRRVYGEVKQDAKIHVYARLSDYKGRSYFNDLRKINLALQQYRVHKNFVRRKTLFRCDFHVVRDNFIVEIDEKQHFSAARRISLLNYTRRLHLGFSLQRWKNLCSEINARDNDPIDRDEQRAWYDMLRDFLPLINGFEPTVRLFTPDYKWCSLNPRSAVDVKHFQVLIGDRRKE
jgi:hypothetical protein